MSLKTWPTTRPGSSTSPVRVSAGVLAVRVGPEVGHHEEVGVRVLLVVEHDQVLVAQRRVRAGYREEIAARRQRCFVDQMVVTVTRRRRDLRCELVAEIDVHVLLADDVVEAAVATTRNCPVGIGDALALAGTGVARAGVRAVFRHDRVDDVVARHERVVVRQRIVVAVLGVEVVAVGAVVREGVAAVEGAFLGLLPHQRHLEAVRPDVGVERVRDVISGEVADRVAVLPERVAAGSSGSWLALGCCQWSVTYALTMTSSSVLGTPSGPGPSR